jgi:hypothetical protein
LSRDFFVQLGTNKPVIAIVAAPFVGILFVYAIILLIIYTERHTVSTFVPEQFFVFLGIMTTTYYPAAFVVHLWLPLFALCIMIVKVFNWFRLAVSKTQWLFRGGKEHPLDAVGYVAAILVFAGAGSLGLVGVVG